MMDRMSSHIDVIARFLMASIFVLAGIGKLGEPESTQAYMMSFGIPGFLLWPSILFEIGMGILLFTGAGTRYVGIVLAIFAMITALIFHTDFGDQSQLILFLKNVAITGGFLMFAKHGSPSFSVDSWLSNRNTSKINRG